MEIFFFLKKKHVQPHLSKSTNLQAWTVKDQDEIFLARAIWLCADCLKKVIFALTHLESVL